jgi:hypothetical protein
MIYRASKYTIKLYEKEKMITKHIENLYNSMQESNCLRILILTIGSLH